MKQEPGKNSRLVPLLGGGLVVLCCGVPLLLASGALSAVGAWLLDGAWVWLAAVPILATGLHLWRREDSRKPHDPADSTATTGATPSPKRQRQ